MGAITNWKILWVIVKEDLKQLPFSIFVLAVKISVTGNR